MLRTRKMESPKSINRRLASNNGRGPKHALTIDQINSRYKDEWILIKEECCHVSTQPQAW